MIVRSYSVTGDIRVTKPDLWLLQQLYDRGRIRDFEIVDERCRFRATQFCGTIQLSSDVVQVIPDIDQGASLPSILYHMLDRIYRGDLQAPRFEISGETFLTESSSMVDIFALLLCRRLALLARDGLHREYVDVSGNERFLHGRLHIAEQLREGHLGTKFQCGYDEFSENNPHNQIIAFTLRQLLSRVDGSRTRREVSQNLLLFSDVDFATTTQDLITRLSYTRLTQHYEPLHDLCLLILNGIGVEATRGNTKATSFLVDLNRVFEAFIATLLSETIGEEGFDVNFQSRTDLLFPYNHSYRLSMRPDVVVSSRNGTRRMVLDAKFKRIFTTGRYGRQAFRTGDFFQIYSYASRLGCFGALVYPGKADDLRGNSPLQWSTERNNSPTIGLCTLDLSVSKEDLGKDLISWAREMLGEQPR